MLPFASLHRTERRRPFGFTLIELLVVIAVIAVLAGILFPVFAKARSRARESTALSNLKQIGAALHMYTADYDEHLPNRWPIWLGYREFYWRVDGGDLPSLLKPYVKNREVWHSPEDREWNRAAARSGPRPSGRRMDGGDPPVPGQAAGCRTSTRSRPPAAPGPGRS